MSDFDKNPARVHTLQDELDCAFEEMRKLRKACPYSRMIMLESNHTDRLRRFLWRKASALSSLRALDIAGLMRLQEIEVEYKENFTYRNFMFKHGDVVRKDAAYTAKAELEREGVSGSSGHTHRLGKHYRTLRGGAYCWIEGGCLCDLKPEYVKGIPNWQHGMVHVSFEKSGSQFYAQDIPIINGKILYGGEIIKA